MGIGRLFTRNIDYVATDTVTGAQESFSLITGAGGAYPTWSGGGDYQGAMGLPAIWRLAGMMADQLGAVPWHVWTDVPGGTAMRLPVTPRLIEQPNAPDVRIDTLSSMVLDHVFHGDAVAVYSARDDDGYPTAYIPVPAESTYVKMVEESDPFPWPVGSRAYLVNAVQMADSRLNGTWYGENDILHIPAMRRPGALTGMGVLDNHLSKTLTLADELERAARSVADAAVPSLLVQSLAPNMTPGEAAALKAKAIESQRTRSPMVVGDTVKVTPLSWNPTETQLIEARQFTLLELALIMGADPSWVGAQQSSRLYGNIETEGLNIWRYSALRGHLARFEQRLSAVLRPAQRARADLDSVLRADTLTRYQAHAVGISGGFLHPDEARAQEGLPPLTPAQRATMPAVTPPSVPSKEGAPA